jgi:D-sedoheptulose 7-phosphate isomerase
VLVSAIDVLALDVDGVLTDGRVEVSPNGDQAKRLCFRDLDAVSQARRAGIKVALVTGEEGPLVDAIARRLGVDTVLTGKKDKHDAVHELATALSTTTANICYVGDADRDAPAFGCVGLGLTPADGSALARSRAHRVLLSPGGSGAVAEAVDLMLRARQTHATAGARESRIQAIIDDSVRAHQTLRETGTAALSEIAAIVLDAVRAGRKVLFCGNGGSAADSQHVAAELVGRFAINREPWAAIALTTDTSVLTAVANDWEYADVFARQVLALARPGDVVVGLSTSGKSPNVVRALETAKVRGAVRIACTGAQGGPMVEHAEASFRAPSDHTPRIQELHILGWHAICEVVEAALVAEAAID